MKILVCGGRVYTDAKKVFVVLNRVLQEKGEFVLIHGSAKGADTLAEDWAKQTGIRYRGYPAKWNELGKLAGPKRNMEMLSEEEPDAIIAFPGGAGTRSMVEIAREKGTPVWEIT